MKNYNLKLKNLPKILHFSRQRTDAPMTQTVIFNFDFYILNYIL